MNGIDALHYKYGFNYVESVLAESVRLLPQYPFVYKDLNTPPFLIIVYTPLYIYASYFIYSFSGALFEAGRLVSFASILFLVAGIYFILRRLGSRSLPSAMLALLFLGFPLLWRHGVTMRNDQMALALEVWGLFAAVGWMGRKGIINRDELWAPLIFFTLAFFTKQSAVAGAGAVAIYLVSSGKVKQAFKFATLQALFIIIPWLFLGWITKGNFFAHQKMLAAQPLYAKLFYTQWAYFFPQAAGFLVLGVLFCAGIGRPKEHNLFSVYFLLCLVLTGALTKVGSDDNYFLAPCWALCVMMGIFLQKAETSRILRCVFWTFFGLQIAYLVSTGPVWSEPFVHEGRKSIEQTMDKASVLISKLRGDIIVENMALLIASGRPIYYEPFEFTQASNAKFWNEELILSKLRNREIKAVVLGFNATGVTRTSNFSTPFLLALHRNYELKGSKSGNYFYVPKT